MSTQTSDWLSRGYQYALSGRWFSEWARYIARSYVRVLIVFFLNMALLLGIHSLTRQEYHRFAEAALIQTPVGPVSAIDIGMFMIVIWAWIPAGIGIKIAIQEVFE